jgi:hypothetical protein
VFQTANLSTAAVAIVSESGLAQTLAAGPYWAALLSDASTAQVEAFSGARRLYHGAANAGANAASYLYKDGQTFASGLPDPFPASPTYATGTAIPYILMTD